MSILIYKLDWAKDSIYTIIQRNRIMSRKCELTGKSPLKGHKVSHANNKVKRKYELLMLDKSYSHIEFVRFRLPKESEQFLNLIKELP